MAIALRLLRTNRFLVPLQGRWRKCANGVLISQCPLSSTVEAQETSKFAYQATEWWDLNGPFKALHSMNSVRVPLITAAVLQSRGGREGGVDASRTLADCSILDVGCGAGLLCEPLARLGATVTGIDPVEESIAAAQQHSGSDPAISDRIKYLCCSTDQLLVDSPETMFDCVVASEVIEHVTEKRTFLQEVSQLVKPGGVACFTTISHTAVSYLLGILAAEQLLGLVPKGTHDWNKFISARDLSTLLRAVNLEPSLVKGLYYNPATNSWSTGDINAVNYYIQASKHDISTE